MMRQQFPQFLSQLAVAALTARREGVDKSQVNKLLEVLDAYDIDTLLVFIVRQTARKELGRCMSRHLITIIEDIIKSGSKDVKSEVRKALGYFKWFFEIFSELGSPALQRIIREKYNDFTTCRESITNVKPDAYVELLESAI